MRRSAGVATAEGDTWLARRIKGIAKTGFASHRAEIVNSYRDIAAKFQSDCNKISLGSCLNWCDDTHSRRSQRNTHFIIEFLWFRRFMIGAVCGDFEIAHVALLLAHFTARNRISLKTPLQCVLF